MNIEDIKRSLRMNDRRDIADAMDYVEEKLAGFRLYDKTFEESMVDDIPLPPGDSEVFVLTVVFGALLERKYPIRADGNPLTQIKKPPNMINHKKHETCPRCDEPLEYDVELTPKVLKTTMICSDCGWSETVNESR